MSRSDCDRYWRKKPASTNDGPSLVRSPPFTDGLDEQGEERVHLWRGERGRIRRMNFSTSTVARMLRSTVC
jgi:hypothetical protein